ncbi:MAG: ComF family protein [Burkholderiales bacterium]|jgi:ComF family protein
MGHLNAWLRSIMPAACVLCAAPAKENGLCDDCSASLPEVNGKRCPICACTTPTGSLCGRCISHPPRYDYVISALDYATPVDFLIAELKYSRNLAAARALGLCLAMHLDEEPYPDIVLPMPIANSRLRERGFNQATEIARHACAPFGLRPCADIAQRTSAGVSQTALPWRDRARNVRNAFRCQTQLHGKTIAVVDDVITTGATLNELATVLKRAGADKVVGWIVARTPAHR